MGKIWSHEQSLSNQVWDWLKAKAMSCVVLIMRQICDSGYINKDGLTEIFIL